MSITRHSCYELTTVYELQSQKFSSNHLFPCKTSRKIFGYILLEILEKISTGYVGYIRNGESANAEVASEASQQETYKRYWLTFVTLCK